MLHLAWRISHRYILPAGSTWEDLFIAHGNAVVDGHEDEFDNPPEDIQFEEPAEEADAIIRDAQFVASRLRPDQMPHEVLGLRPIDEAELWDDLSSINVVLEQVLTYLKNLILDRETRQLERKVIPFDSLSEVQRQVINLVRDENLGIIRTPKRILVQGRAGTGKSALILQIYRHLDRFPAMIVDEVESIYEVLAPTGAAANNINGRTIHSFLRIPVGCELHPLTGENLRAFRLQMARKRFIIFDECSIIGARLFRKIERRLIEASGNSSEPFGGFNLHFFGDIRQLPPVKDIPIYRNLNNTDNESIRGTYFMSMIQKTFVLTVCHRQNDEQDIFKQILDSIASGAVTPAGWRILMQRRASINSIEEFSGALRIFPTNELVDQYNIETLSRNRRPVALIKASNNNATAAQASDILTQGLVNKLYLSIGCRVMLRRNICVARGLVNGSLGTVENIIYLDQESPPQLHAIILVKFDKFRGPVFLGDSIPVIPITAPWRDQGVDCSRRQFPLCLAYAITIHKNQGLTLDKAVVDIGAREIAAGGSYVALSRVRRLEDVLILNSFDFSRFRSIELMLAVQERERFLQSIVS